LRRTLEDIAPNFMRWGGAETDNAREPQSPPPIPSADP
jgi:hypothetical protein